MKNQDFDSFLNQAAVRTIDTLLGESKDDFDRVFADCIEQGWFDVEMLMSRITEDQKEETLNTMLVYIASRRNDNDWTDEDRIIVSYELLTRMKQ